MPTRAPRKPRLHDANVSFSQSVVSIIETNVDDVTGEILSQAVEKILSEGALDCTLIPFVGKKGRPGFTIRVIAENRLTRRLASLLVLETGTLGVKVSRTTILRVTRNSRRVRIRIGDFNGLLTVKLASSSGRFFRIKPEMEEIKKIAESTGINAREVEEIATSQARAQLRTSVRRK
jgi:pyridinium-3,5-bisthiocarboxylic acid mononucleotide nickel chelatase